MIVFFIHILVEEAVFVVQARHSRVELPEQISAFLADGKVKIRGTHSANGNILIKIVVGVDSEIGVYRAAVEQLHYLVARLGHLDDLRIQPVQLDPVFQELDLDAALCYSYLLAVQREVVVGADLPVIPGHKKIVFLGAHRQIRKIHLFRAFLGEGNVAHQVDFALGEHLQQIRPASLDILVVPAGVGGDFTLVLIRIARAPAEPIHSVEGRFVPSDAHDLALCLFGADRQSCNRSKY